MYRLPLARLLITAWLAGLVLGIGGGAVITLVAAAAAELDPPSWLGTLDVVLLAVTIGVVGGAPYLVLRALPRIEALWLGAAWGAVVFVALVALLPDVPRSAVLALGPGSQMATSVLSGALFIAWGVALEWIARLLLEGRDRHGQIEAG
jgi:hypothetical protein